MSLRILSDLTSVSLSLRFHLELTLVSSEENLHVAQGERETLTAKRKRATCFETSGQPDHAHARTNRNDFSVAHLPQTPI